METRTYTHELGKRVEAISGWYELEKEGRFRVEGREVLYIVGVAAVDSSCCGVWGCRYALVPGYVLQFKARKNDQGCWISEVEPVADGESRQEIIRVLMKEECVQQVRFC